MLLQVEGKTSKLPFSKTMNEEERRRKKSSASRKKIQSEIEIAKGKLKNGRRSIIII